MKRYIYIVLLILLIANFSYRIDLKKSPHKLIGELMYFPSGVAVKALSMGFYAPLADLVWLRFIQYYGEHRMTDVRFELMYHILDILTTLDTRFVHAYNLGALMLAHDAQSPDQAFQLLKKAMYLNPEDWRYPFVYGFINYVFLAKYKVAEVYFRLAGQKPNATDMPKRWAAYCAYRKVGDLKTALALWLDLYNSTNNPEEKKIAEVYIKEIKMKLDIQFLNKKVKEFTEKFKHPPYGLRELVLNAIIDSIPTEPHGGKYYLSKGRVKSSWELRLKRRFR